MTVAAVVVVVVVVVLLLLLPLLTATNTTTASTSRVGLYTHHRLERARNRLKNARARRSGSSETDHIDSGMRDQFRADGAIALDDAN